MSKKDEQAREGQYYDPARVGFDYDPTLATEPAGTVKVKKRGRLVRAEERQGEMPTPVDAAATTRTPAKGSAK